MQEARRFALKDFTFLLLIFLFFSLVAVDAQAKSVSDPNHDGYTGKYPKLKQVEWKAIKTKCDKCTLMAGQYNQTVQELLNHRYWVHFWREVSRFRDEGKKDPMWPGKGDISEFDAKAITANMELMDLQRQQLDMHRKAVFALEQQASYLAKALQDCERTACRVKKPTKIDQILIGGDKPTQAFQPDVDAILKQYGIDWKGPYRTNCNPCQKIVAQLNAMPGWVVRAHLALQRAEIQLEYAEHIKKSNKVSLSFMTYSHPDKTDYDQLPALVKKLKDELAALKRLFDKLVPALDECRRKFCPKLKEEDISLGDDLEYLITCPNPAANESILVGPNDEVGSSAKFQEKMKDKAKGVVGGLLGGLLGGGGNGDGGSSDDGTVKDPVKKKHKLEIEDKAAKRELLTGAIFTPDGLLVSTNIKKAPGDGTFHTVYLENDRGWRMVPIGLYLYEIWKSWKLTVSWTKDTYVDGEHVSHEEGGWSESWKELIAKGEEVIYGEVYDAPIWQQMGFNTAASGVRGLGTLFPVSPAMLREEPMNLVIHITDPDEDPVMTYPYVLRLSLGDDDTVLVEEIDQSRAMENEACTNPVADLPPAVIAIGDDVSSAIDDADVLDGESPFTTVGETPEEGDELVVEDSDEFVIDPWVGFVSAMTRPLVFMNMLNELLDENSASPSAAKDAFGKSAEAWVKSLSEEERATYTRGAQNLIDNMTSQVKRAFEQFQAWKSSMDDAGESETPSRPTAELTVYLAEKFEHIIAKLKAADEESKNSYMVEMRNEARDLRAKRDELATFGSEASVEEIEELDEQIEDLERKANNIQKTSDVYRKDANTLIDALSDEEKRAFDRYGKSRGWSSESGKPGQANSSKPEYVEIPTEEFVDDPDANLTVPAKMPSAFEELDKMTEGIEYGKVETPKSDSVETPDPDLTVPAKIPSLSEQIEQLNKGFEYGEPEKAPAESELAPGSKATLDRLEKLEKEHIYTDENFNNRALLIIRFEHILAKQRAANNALNNSYKLEMEEEAKVLRAQRDTLAKDDSEESRRKIAELDAQIGDLERKAGNIQKTADAYAQEARNMQYGLDEFESKAFEEYKKSKGVSSDLNSIN